MNDTAIKITNLSKVFYSYAKPRYRLQEMMKPILGRLHPRFDRNYADEFWALKDINFEVKKGESLGIIGRNGAGKSTLLQIIAGTLTPTTGEVEVNGRVNALLELGSGFNPDFTGRENVYMNGSILGFRREQIEAKFSEIHDFSEIGDFIDQPVKTYSSGMFVRLAFAVQALLEPEILIVDEALSVGDIFFQQKCHARISELLEKGETTFLFVSHDTGSVLRYCKKSILLNQGKMIAYEESPKVTSIYFKLERGTVEFVKEKNNKVLEEVDTKSNQKENNLTNDIFSILDKTSVDKTSYGCFPEFAEINKYGIINKSNEVVSNCEVGDTVEFAFEVKLNKELLLPLFGIAFKNAKNDVVFAKFSNQDDQFKISRNGKEGDIYQIVFKIQMDLFPAEYTFSLALCSVDLETFNNRHILSEQAFMSKRKYLWDFKAGVFQVLPKKEGIPYSFWGMVGLKTEVKLELC